MFKYIAIVMLGFSLLGCSTIYQASTEERTALLVTMPHYTDDQSVICLYNSDVTSVGMYPKVSIDDEMIGKLPYASYLCALTGIGKKQILVQSIGINGVYMVELLPKSRTYIDVRMNFAYHYQLQEVTQDFALSQIVGLQKAIEARRAEEAKRKQY